MLKFMNNRYGQSRIFMEADKGGGSGGSSGSNDDSGDESGSDDDLDDKADDDEGGDDDPDADEKKFSQKDVDAAVKKQLEKEKRKWQREQKKKESKKPAGKDTSDGGTGETDTNSDELKAERAKTSGLEMKLACFEAGVAKDSVSDVAALAKSYMEADEDLDLEDAMSYLKRALKKWWKNTRSLKTAVMTTVMIPGKRKRAGGSGMESLQRKLQPCRMKSEPGCSGNKKG